jgi:ornithine cyclodeaminase/alanine dehydrogenase-like protein (mu-crystallin family)
MSVAPRMIGAEELRARVHFRDLIEPVSSAFQESARKRAQNGLLTLFPADRPEEGDVYVKTGVLRGHSVYIVKVSPWFAINVERGSPQGGFIAVFDSRTGHTLALLDEQHYLSDIRTAAAGAVAARMLAPPQIDVASVLGAGTQAFWQAQALFVVRPFQKLIIWARDEQKARGLKTRLSPMLPAVGIEISTDIESAVRRADVLVTTTLARQPIVRGEWLHAGQHITAVGADDPTKCELDAAVLNRARVFVDSADTTLACGDVHRAVQEGQYRAECLAGELGDVLDGSRKGRLAADDITVAKFVGIGAQDLVAAEVALRLCSDGVDLRDLPDVPS